MSRGHTDSSALRHDEAILRAVLVHGVPVRTLARAIGVSRQTVYRRMQRARINLRRAADAAAAERADPTSGDG